MNPTNRHKSYWAFLGHRLSGITLALFLPIHFLMLGLALEDAATLDTALSYSDLLPVKIAEWGLVVLLTIHLIFGLRLLMLEVFPWPSNQNTRTGWITVGAGAAVIIGFIFLLGAF